MEDIPLVSVVIPTYNREKYIRRAIESVIDQTFKNYDIIVVDDGSTDNTEEVVKKLNVKCTYIKQENSGSF